MLDLSRKFWAFYISFLDFSPRRLSSEHFWLPLAIIRTSVAKLVVGGISGCVAEFLKSAFGEPGRLARGFTVHLPAPTLICGRFHMFLADGDAERACWSCKGASGVRPCFLCSNVVVDRHASTDEVVSIACPDARRFSLVSDQDVFEAVDLLHATHGAMSNDDFKALETATGMTFMPGALLSRPDIRAMVSPASAHRYDSMHCLLVNGVLNHEVAIIFNLLKEHVANFSYEHIRSFVSTGWIGPRAYTSGLATLASRMFANKRESDLKKKAFKASASDLLTMMPMIRAFVSANVEPLAIAALDQPLKSFFSLCEVIDCIVRIKRQEPVGNFGACMQKFMRCHGDAYGGASFKPKHHWSMHLPAQYISDGALIDTFVLERKHTLLKTCGHSLRHTGRFERTVITNAVLQQTESLSSYRDCDRVEEPTKDCPLLGDAALVSRSLHFGGVALHVGDVVYLDSVALRITACGLKSRKLLVCGHAMELVERVSAKESVWKIDVRGPASVVELEGRAACLPYAWRAERGDALRILNN